MSTRSQLSAWYRKDTTRRGMLMAGVALGADCLIRLLADGLRRFDALEERGLVPLDDLATVGDLAKLEGRVKRLEPAPAEDAAP